MKPNAVVIATDANQFPAGLFLADRLARLAPPADTEIILFSDSAAHVEAGLAVANGRFAIRHLVSPVRFQGSGYVSGATFYRFLLPRLSAARRVLYMDVDTYPDSEKIWKLLELDLHGAMLAAVRDITMAYIDVEENRNELIRTDTFDTKRYFNAGVLLIDGEKFVANSMGEKLIDFVARSSISDQTALNVALQDDWLELSIAFNMQPVSYLSGISASFEPVISHFAGKEKPWHGPLFYLDHRARAEIEEFLAGTPWRDFITRIDPSRVEYRPWTPPQSFLQAAHRYLTETRFADVEQGITEMRDAFRNTSRSRYAPPDVQT